MATKIITDTPRGTINPTPFRSNATVTTSDGLIARQSLTTPPFILDGTLVDDPVALVDDHTALVGSQTTITTTLRTTVTTAVPRPRVNIGT